MRKFVTIVGVGERIHGTSSKTNKPYDFTPVAFQYDDNRFAGVKCATTNISADAFGSYAPRVGDSVEVVMREDYKTGRVFVDAVL